MALSQGLIDTYWRRYNQRRALTGLPSSYQEQRGMLDPMMESAANKDIQEARIRADNAIRDRQLSIQEQAQKDAARAATISGIGQTAGLLGSGYLMNKSINASSSANARLLTLLEGGPKPSMEIPSTGMFAGPNPWSVGAGSGSALPIDGVGSGALPAPGALTAPGYTPPVLAGPTSFAEAGAPGAVSSVPGTGSALLSAVPQIAALYGAQYATGKMVQPYLDKAGFSNAGKGWTYAGLPGAMVGGSIDLGKKGFESIKDIGSSIGNIFGW